MRTIIEEAMTAMKQACDRIDELNTQVNTLMGINTSQANKILRLQEQISMMTVVMRDNNILCESCGEALTDDLLQYGICESCSRLLS